MTISLSAKAITIFDRRVQNLPGWMCTFRNRVNTLQVWKILSCGMLFKKRCEVPIGSVIMLIIYEILWFRAQQLVSFQVVNTHFLSKHIKWIRLQFIWGRVVTNFNIGNLGKEEDRVGSSRQGPGKRRGLRPIATLLWGLESGSNIGQMVHMAPGYLWHKLQRGGMGSICWVVDRLGHSLPC